MKSESGGLSTEGQLLRMPFCILNNNKFYSSDYFEPRKFNKWFRKNGFSRPFHGFMLLAWCYFIIIVVGLYAFLYQFIQQPLKTIISCITVPLFIIQTASTIYTMAIDPMDLRIKRARVERNIDYVKVVGVPVIDPDTGYCGICRVQVGSGTKHCKPCNKCVSEFDHHCGFLSTCIGSRNYLSFSISIGLGWILSFVLSALAFYLFSLYFNEPLNFQASVTSFIPSATQVTNIVMLILISIYGFFTILGVVFFTHLCMFHIKLWLYNMTTIDYLEYKDAKKWDPNHWRLDPKIPRKRKHPRTRLRKCGCDDDADSSATSTTTTNAANQNNITNSVATSSPVTIA